MTKNGNGGIIENQQYHIVISIWRKIMKSESSEKA